MEIIAISLRWQHAVSLFRALKSKTASCIEFIIRNLFCWHDVAVVYTTFVLDEAPAWGPHRVIVSWLINEQTNFEEPFLKHNSTLKCHHIITQSTTVFHNSCRYHFGIFPEQSLWGYRQIENSGHVVRGQIEFFSCSYLVSIKVKITISCWTLTG